MQYSLFFFNIPNNYIFFDKYKDCISHSVGHFVESFPIAASAFTLNFIDIFGTLSIYRNVILFHCFIILYFIFKYDLFLNITIYSQTYNYNGLDKVIFSIFSFIGFYLIPFEKIKSNKLKLIIKLSSNFTLGIYCIHPLIAYYLEKLFLLKSTFKGCLTIYIISYLISFLCSKLCSKSKIKFLFI